METKATDLQCCVTVCDRPLNADYWNAQYQAGQTGWDLGMVSPPIKAFIDTLTDKNLRILIPGCGNAYEAEYLLNLGFQNITLIDIAPTAVESLQQKFAYRSEIKVVLGDFFAHQSEYDLIIEQTFFCALPPQWREKYVLKMFHLLANGGQLAGLLFNRSFESGPPFGGSANEYKALFKDAFAFRQFDAALNSAAPRAGSELFIQLEKLSRQVSLYHFTGITCSGCRSTIIAQMKDVPGVLNASISSDFSNLLIVSEVPISIATLQKAIAYDAKYGIEEITA
ncbi:MAG: methyltransferase domain-containing protein [Flavobacteriales bacterium]